MTAPVVELRVLDADGFSDWVDDAVDVYATALKRPKIVIPSRRVSTREHLAEPGFRAVVAVQAERLIGFAYGFHDQPGQWWHDIVVQSLDQELVQRWMSEAFQVTELHVLPLHQRQGLGRQLLTSLLTDTGRSTAVLSAFDDETPARQLYRRSGFIDLMERLRFPGNVEVYAVMAADLPLSS